MYLEDRLVKLEADITELKLRNEISEVKIKNLVFQLAMANKDLADLQEERLFKALTKFKKAEKEQKLKNKIFESNAAAKKAADKNRNEADADSNSAEEFKRHGNPEDRQFSRRSTKRRDHVHAASQARRYGSRRNENKNTDNVHQANTGRVKPGPVIVDLNQVQNEGTGDRSHNSGRKSFETADADLDVLIMNYIIGSSSQGCRERGSCSSSSNLIDSATNTGRNNGKTHISRGGQGSTVNGPDTLIVPNAATIIEQLEANACDLCGDTFRTEKGLRGHQLDFHLKINKTKYMCTCGKGFPYREQLKNHWYYHTKQGKDKRFACKFCVKQFRDKFDLVIHERIHTGARPFECSQCHKRFINMSNLTKHVKKTHLKSFPCPTCAKKFQRAESLRLHRRQCNRERHRQV